MQKYGARAHVHIAFWSAWLGMMLSACGPTKEEVERQKIAAAQATAAAEAASAAQAKAEELRKLDAGFEPYKKKIVARLLDPESARFRNLKLLSTQRHGTVLCGEVNAKNRFGGYAGFTTFVVANGPTFIGGTDAIVADEVASNESTLFDFRGGYRSDYLKIGCGKPP